MSDHITPEQTEKFRNRSLSAPDLLALDDHLSECEACRNQLSIFQTGSAVWRDLMTNPYPGSGGHPTHEELAGFIDRRIGAEDRTRIEAHLRECDACREDVTDLLAFQAELNRRPAGAHRHGNWFLVSGIAAVLVIGIALVIASRQRSPGGEDPKTRHGPELAVALQDDGTTIGLDHAGQFHGPPSLGEADRALLANALRDGSVHLERPSQFHSGPSTLRGATEGQAAFRLIQPVQTLVLADRPEFRWTPAPGATRYEIQIFDPAFNLVEKNGPLDTTSWRPEKPLSRGHTYLWQVTAHRGSTEIREPQPPAPEARFEILDAARAQPLERLVHTEDSESRLLLAIKLAAAGLGDDAREELDRLAAENPGSPLAAHLRDSVH